MDDPRPRVLVCEDGDEYTERFTRLLGRRFAFVRAGCFSEAARELAAGSFRALVLDLDFRRTPAGLLLGEALVEGVAQDLHAAAASQGILLLRALRARGVLTPALLCADLDDPARERLLCAELSPLQLVPSAEGLQEVAARIFAL
jgi:hypothetical protein